MADITIHQAKGRLQQAQLVDVREDNEVGGLLAWQAAGLPTA